MPDWLATEMRACRKNSWNKSHVYVMPAVGWKWVLDYLRTDAYGPRGGFAHNAPTLYSAIAKIADAVRKWELHPAFDERGIVGVSGELVPAFLKGDGTRSPYPPGDFVVLAPHHVLDRGRKLTEWRRADWVSSEDPLCSEDFHLRFFIQMLGSVPDL
jgi:hypothetical protein